ncbi:MAG: DEAD/DEAH box helicase family protein [Dermatophilaceae bacterium]
MTPGGEPRLAAEQRARALIDQQLEAAGWHVHDIATADLFTGQGVALREKTMKKGHGRADYLLYVDRRVVGVIEAKPQGVALSGVEWQSAKYATGLNDAQRARAVTVDGRLPFVVEANGSETYLTNGYDPEPRARRLFAVPRPETLARVIRDAAADAANPTWRAKVRHLPPLDPTPLRSAQVTAIDGIERSLAGDRFDRSLVQMATGAGKTYTAVTAAYRLLTHGGFQRVLFLVDRTNLGKQTYSEFERYRAPGDGRLFTEIYDVDKLTSTGLVASSSVVISTIQRVHLALRGTEIPDADDAGLDAYVPNTPVTVGYQSELPPEAFDLVIVDEAHRSIYGVWRGVLEYFDAHIVGLTATPGKQTFAFFRQNLVSEYTYPQSVADLVNVDFDIYRIRTEVSERGGRVEAGTIVPKVDRRTRATRYEELEEDLDYTHRQLDRAVTSTHQIRLVLETFRDRLFTEIFPGRREVPKTLIFAKDDAHAEEIVRCVRDVFGRGNAFAAKITYAAKDAGGQLQAFRNSPDLRVAVTVDMIATGTDVKPIECVFFLRDVRSKQYFEQMKGRGCRTIPEADFRAVTPDATAKTRFVIVDAVGVTEHDFVDPPLNRVTGVSMTHLLRKAAALDLTEGETATLASRLGKLELDLTPAERAELDAVAGMPVGDIVRGLVAAVDPDAQAAALAGAADPDAALVALLDRAVQPIAANPALRERIIELRAMHDRVIDEVTRDVLLDAHGVVDTARARSMVESWRSYLEQHRDEITAIQLVQESGERRVAFADVQQLADRIQRPPHHWTTELLWGAYEAVDAGRVRRSEQHTLTDLVSLLRYTTGVDDELVPYADRVRERYAGWLAQQSQGGVEFSALERWWLDRMVEVIATSAGIAPDDLDDAPFTERGGVDGALRDLGPTRAPELLRSLNHELTA